MKVIENLCQPALLYLLFIVIQVGLELSLGLYAIAAVKVVTGLAGVYLLNIFCEVDLGLLSWVIIAAPFIMTALATSIALGLNLNNVMTASMVEHFDPASVKPVSAGEAVRPARR